MNLFGRYLLVSQFQHVEHGSGKTAAPARLARVRSGCRRPSTRASAGPLFFFFLNLKTREIPRARRRLCCFGSQSRALRPRSLRLWTAGAGIWRVYGDRDSFCRGNELHLSKSLSKRRKGTVLLSRFGPRQSSKSNLRNGRNSGDSLSGRVFCSAAFCPVRARATSPRARLRAVRGPQN